MTGSQATKTLTATALFAALHAVFSDVHPAGDQIVQTGHQANHKGLPGWVGRRACAGHVATYTATQYAAAAAVCKALGWRVPWTALAVGHIGVNATTHYLLDRRAPLRKLMSKLGKASYMEWGTVQRGLDKHGEPIIDPGGGPGTAVMELDQASHRIVGLVSSLLTALIVVHTNRI
jgi:hypothetical protein